AVRPVERARAPGRRRDRARLAGAARRAASPGRERLPARARRHPSHGGPDALARPGVAAAQRATAGDDAAPRTRAADAVGRLRAEHAVAAGGHPPPAGELPAPARACECVRGRDHLPSSGDPLGDGGFQECSGLGVEMDVQEYLEGGRNDGVIKRVGRAKVQPLVLKRGMFFERGELANDDLWRWLEDVVSGVRPVARYDGIVEVLDDTGDDAVARWA